MVTTTSKLKRWMNWLWQRALARDAAYELRDNVSYRICVELWRLPTREPRREETA